MLIELKENLTDFSAFLNQDLHLLILLNQLFSSGNSNSDEKSPQNPQRKFTLPYLIELLIFLILWLKNSRYSPKGQLILKANFLILI